MNEWQGKPKFSNDIFIYTTRYTAARRSVVVKALCYKMEGRAGLGRDEMHYFYYLLLPNSSSCIGRWGVLIL
jgi:hypothetical protein